MVKELNSGLPQTNLASVRMKVMNPGPTGLHKTGAVTPGSPEGLNIIESLITFYR